MAEKKRYVVRNGKETGIFSNWDEVKPLVSGFPGAKYKGFKSLKEAKYALEKGYEEYYQPVKKRNEREIDFVKESIAVDAACSSATGVMEYKGVDLVSQKEIFKFLFPEGTNNIGEFLAIVHGLSWIKKENKQNYSLYSDSKIAITWISQKRCKTNYIPKDPKLLEIIKRAENWLKNNSYLTPILKWNTEEWGEIPADFGRK